MSTTASTSYADTVDDGNSPEAHEESNTQANNGASEADKAVVITNNDAAKAAESTKDATVDTTTTTDKNASTENKAADTSKLEKKAVDSATISNNKASTTENAKAGSVQTNKAANNTSAANNAQTSNKKTTTATDSSKAAAQLVKDATANTADVANNVAGQVTVNNAGQAGKKAATDTTTTFNLNTADLGKLSKNVLDHSNLDNLLRNSFVQTNSTDKVTLNANTLGSSLTNGDATALAASLRTASGNNDTSNYKTVTDWSGLQSAVSSGAEGVIVSGNITATNDFFNLAPHNDLNINGNFTIVGADKNASINLNNNVILNPGIFLHKNLPNI